jgi:hypothetical protein
VRGEVRRARGGFIGTARCTGGRGPASARERALGGAGARTGVNRRCQPRSNTCARCFCPSSSWLGANLREFGQDRCEGFVHQTLLCLLCMDVARF